MLMDAIRGYIQIASGLTDATSEKAKEVAQALLSVAGMANPTDVTSQVSGMAEEVLSTARAQRANLVALVRAEVTTVVDGSGLAKAADLDVLKSRLTKVAADVEQLVKELPGAGAREEAARFVEEHTPAALTAASMRARVRPAKKAPAKKATAKAGSAKKAPASTGAPARKAATNKAATKKATTNKATTKKATTKKATAPRKGATTKKTTSARKATAKKTAGTG